MNSKGAGNFIPYLSVSLDPGFDSTVQADISLETEGMVDAQKDEGWLPTTCSLLCVTLVATPALFDLSKGYSECGLCGHVRLCALALQSA